MIGAERSQISANAAVDYSKPVQKLSYYWANVVPSDNMSTVQNNWRQVTSYRNMPADADLSSFRLSAYATNNYGTDFDIWFTIIAEDTGETIYNSGWKTSPIINEPVYIYRTYSRVRCVMRIRYNDDSGYTNPPANAEFSGVNWVINYDYYVNYSDNNIPDNWLGTDTQPTMSAATLPIDTTTVTIAPSEIEQFNPFEIQGFPSSWTGFVTYLTYVLDEMPWIPILIGFFGLCSILWWLLM